MEDVFGFGSSFTRQNAGFKPSAGPVINYGIIGVDTDLPLNDFWHSGGNIVGIFATADETGDVYRINVRVRSRANENNRMQVAIYDRTGLDSGNNMIKSLDIITFGTADQVLSFDIEKSIIQSDEYVLVAQGEDEWFFYYDNSAENDFVFLGNAGFGDFPTSFAAASTFPNIFQIWGNFSY